MQKCRFRQFRATISIEWITCTTHGIFEFLNGKVDAEDDTHQWKIEMKVWDHFEKQPGPYCSVVSRTLLRPHLQPFGK